ncbi:MAG: NADH-quinone oxidoreductase subunit C [Verrucomicrobia bacterium]|nr:NADH-quinone oxidoreductase subunit C [Verrucomicrobiota bacterium]MCG2680502.1 NADH-quinone oxidoreductase subunit C [Kiritimatiellia bacterium]MBU4248225.1 NADH-quinone oxidoreductase subunit C [Verrucomicrobiota bacterium]MBU4290428.1 NADH-quinone oxidoreductase subunit C [Verrucomicrobiota bacterium]MBU4430165.1 NADH-quinone oxidoreductase subunit C [Verrucomicrobiota bacterium]
MTNEEKIKKELLERFGFSTEQIRVARERRVFLEVPHEQFRRVFEHAVNGMDFQHLCTITGLDDGDTLAFVYHLARLDGAVLSLKTRVPKASPVLRTISDLFPGGMIYERELADLLGARVEGLPEGNRYPLPEGWPDGQHPLRKDWKAEMLDGVYPKEEVKSHG